MTRMTRRASSLAFRVGLAAALVVLIGGILTGWYSYRAARHEADEMFDARLVQTAQVLAGLAGWTDFARRERDADHAYAQGLHPYQGRLIYRVWHVDARGARLVAHSAMAERVPPLGPDARGFHDLAGNGEDWRLFAYSTGRIFVQSAENLAARDELSGKIALRNALPFLFVTPVLALLAFLATRRALAPLSALARELDARPPDHLAPLAEDHPSRELSPIVTAVNRLMARAADTLERERRFTSDAAHELRTPLAGMAAQLDAALLGEDAEELRDSIRGARRGLRALSDRVAQMLVLTRIEAPGAQAQTPIDLVSEVRAACAELAPAALMAHLELSFDTTLPEDGTVTATLRREWLGMLLGNLIGNALRHAPAGGRIEARLERVAGGVALVVRDTGPGVPEELLPRLGERFFRVARESAVNGVEGTGLGLSIVDRIARLAGARMAFSNHPEGGLVARVTFPVPTPHA